MLAKKLLNNAIPTLKLQDTVEKALSLFEEGQYVVLPLVDNQQFMGFISEETLLATDYHKKINDILLPFFEIYLLPTAGIIEIIRKFSIAEIDLLPVIDANGVFLGLVQKSDIFQSFITALDLLDNGGILELTFRNHDFSISEIARIIESEKIKIKTIFQTEEYIDYATKVIVTIKLNSSIIGGVINALNRFGYDVSAYFSSEAVSNIEKDRLDLLMKYLSI